MSVKLTFFLILYFIITNSLFGARSFSIYMILFTRINLYKNIHLFTYKFITMRNASMYTTTLVNTYSGGK